MKVEEKLSFTERIDVAKGIILNIKDDFKLLAERVEGTQEKAEYLLCAKNACDTAITLGKLQMTIMLVEQVLKTKMEDVKNG